MSEVRVVGQNILLEGVHVATLSNPNRINTRAFADVVDRLEVSVALGTGMLIERSADDAYEKGWSNGQQNLAHDVREPLLEALEAKSARERVRLIQEALELLS